MVCYRDPYLAPCSIYCTVLYDLEAACKGLVLQLFADDTAVFKSGKDLIAVNDCLNKELSNLMNWT